MTDVHMHANGFLFSSKEICSGRAEIANQVDVKPS